MRTQTQIQMQSDDVRSYRGVRVDCDVRALDLDVRKMEEKELQWASVVVLVLVLVLVFLVYGCSGSVGIDIFRCRQLDGFEEAVFRFVIIIIIIIGFLSMKALFFPGAWGFSFLPVADNPYQRNRNTSS